MGISKKPLALALIAMAVSLSVSAQDSLEITLNKVSASGVGEKIGVVKVEDTEYGALFRPELEGLNPGLHGFHVHEKPDCGPAEQEGKPVAALAAGGHWVGNGEDRHEGPYGKGHQGDLPALYVDDQGRASHPVLAPRVKVADLKGHSLMLHEGGDNYSDHPEKLGGGAGRVACGVIEK